MSDDVKSIAKMRAVTISREYGSGGGEVAARLAQRLGWHLIDHEAVVRIAQDLGISEEEVAAHDERGRGIFARLINTMQGIEPSLYVNAPTEAFTSEQDYHEALRRVIAAAMREGHVVIVGRGAQVALNNRHDVLHARIVASIEQRVPYIMRREGLNESEARKRITGKDQDRHRYLQEVYNRTPDDPHLYDIVVNTDIIDLDSAVDLIYIALQRKVQRLSASPEELGPGAGMSRYPGQPEDFHFSNPE
jgi:cytidylate kinase